MCNYYKSQNHFHAKKSNNEPSRDVIGSLFASSLPWCGSCGRGRAPLRPSTVILDFVDRPDRTFYILHPHEALVETKVMTDGILTNGHEKIAHEKLNFSQNSKTKNQRFIFILNLRSKNYFTFLLGTFGYMLQSKTFFIEKL